MFKSLKFIFKIIIFLAVVVLLILGYLGFVPGLSSLFGSDKPRDLGVAYTSADLESFRAKTGVKVDDLPAGLAPAQSLKFSSQVAIKHDFTESELTANLNAGKWKYFPLSDAQVKISNDGLVELSAILHKDHLLGFAQAKNLPAGELSRIQDYLKYLPSDPPIYLRGVASVTDNHVQLNLQQAIVGKVSVPASFFSSEAQAAGGKFLEDWIASVPNFSIHSLTFSEGQLYFDGTYPAEKATSNN
jgi:hypothetical protein